MPAIVVSKSDGLVIDLNSRAQDLFGPARGRRCWELVTRLADPQGLPCRPGCVGELLAAERVEGTRHVQVASGGRLHHLTCVPAGNTAVCVLTRRGARTPRPRECPTARERQVLAALADGSTTAEIAAALGVRDSTVRAHVERLLAKFHVGTRAALVAAAFRMGFLA